MAPDGKESACNVGDMGLIPGLGRSPGEGNVYPPQYFAWRIQWAEKASGKQCPVIMYLVPTVLWLNTLQTIWNFGGDFGEVTKGEESDTGKTEKGIQK